MTQLRNIYLILTILLLGLSCKKTHHIELCSYSSSDSLTYQDPQAHCHIDLISEVHLSQLKCNSDEVTEQRIAKNINNFIINGIASDYKDEPADSIVNHIVKNNMSELLSNLHEKNLFSSDSSDILSPIYDSTELTDTLYYRINADSYFGLSDTILCVRLSSSIYTGGAHPGTITNCYNFSLTDGSMIRLGKIIPSEHIPTLLSRIKSRLLEKKYILSESELALNENHELDEIPQILLEKDSILLFYGSYSIAPFSAGEIELKFSYQELEDLTTIQL